MKLERMPLNKLIYEQLRQDILERRVEFGEKLINRELQQKYGVSSTPIRDAINRLYMDGLVEDISNSGARVVTFDLQFILEINEMLALLSCAALKHAAHRTDQAKLCAQLEEALLRQGRLIGTEEYYDFDFRFHQAFFDHCGNRQYQKTYSGYHVLADMLFRRLHDQINSQKGSVEQHQQILNAYRAGDVILAAEHMKAHFLRAEQLFRQHLF